jgi:hypothetical protein
MVMHELQALGIWEIGMCCPLLGHGNQYSVLAITVENPRSTKEKKQVKQPARSTCTDIQGNGANICGKEA